MMRSHASVAAGVLAGLVLLAGCITVETVTGERGSGQIETITPDVGEFNAVQADATFDVALQVGGAFGLEVRADDNIIDRVRAEVSGDTLELSVSGSVTNATLEADVTVPASSLVAVQADGASTITGSEALQAAEFEVDADGASTVELTVEVERLVVSADGASTVVLAGSAVTLEADANGASTLRLFDLSSVNAVVEADGASTAEAAVSGSLDAEADGASTIRYDGSPAEVVEDSSGASSIAPR